MEDVGNNILPAVGLSILPDTISEAGHDPGSLFALLDSFLLCGTPVPNLGLPSFINFPHMLGYFQMAIE